MHPSSYNSMAQFVREYLDDPGRVLDVGSRDINGSYRPLFEDWEYVGIDIFPGNGVDIVAQDAYHWELADGSFDVVISGSAFEHIERDDLTVEEIARVLKPGGMCCIIAPSEGPKHKYPEDYRRYTTSSLGGLVEKVGLEVVELYRNDIRIWFDIVCIAKKAVIND